MEQQDSTARPLTKASDFGKLEHGCEHYRRRCKIRAPCCDQIFPCRHCHNEAMSYLSNLKDCHELVRQDVKQVVCLICNAEQQVAQVCSNCGVNMGEYYCDICKFYDDDATKGQFHCEGCGICRVGGRDKFFHCMMCGSCHSTSLYDNDSCVENCMKNFCPVCYEYLFDSIKDTTIMKCGHTMHMDCFHAMAEHNQYRCPICSKTVFDMLGVWRSLDEEKLLPCPRCTSMRGEYTKWHCLGRVPHHKIVATWKVSILCNDCNNTSKVRFHILGHKCSHCNSYNTRRISAPDNQ